MTDNEIKETDPRIGSDSEPLPSKHEPPRATFFLSDNFKWLMVTIAIPLSTFLFGQWQEHVAAIQAQTQQSLEDKRRDMEERLGDARNNVAAMTALLPALADSDPKKAKLALIVLEQLKQAQHTTDTHLDEAAAAMRRLISDLQHSSDPRDLQQAADLQESYSAATGAKPAPALAATVAVATSKVDKATAEKPRLVYIQIFGAAQHNAAEGVRSMLRGDGIGAPGIEDVSTKLAGRMRSSPPQIRYFSNTDLGRARWLASHLPPVQGKAWSVVRTQAQNVPEGQLELWWPFPAEG